VVKRIELENTPKFKESISKRNDVQCSGCKKYGMNHMTIGKIGYGMIGYTLEDVRKRGKYAA